MKLKLTFIFLFSFVPLVANAAEDDRVNLAVETVSKLCLSGSEYAIQADAKGNVTIKNFNPKGGGSVSVNVREQTGATALQEDLRIIGDRDIRECTQKHIGRIIDAIFEQTPASESPRKTNSTITRSKFIGYVPDVVSVTEFAEGKNNYYYRFTVKEASSLDFSLRRNHNSIFYFVLSAQGTQIFQRGWVSSGDVKRDVFFLPGDYYIRVICRDSESTPFSFKIEGFPEA